MVPLVGWNRPGRKYTERERGGKYKDSTKSFFSLPRFLNLTENNILKAEFLLFTNDVYVCSENRSKTYRNPTNNPIIK